MNGFLGIDTSCYTTSLAYFDASGKLVTDLRKPLEVKAGGRGLAQSEMVFQHVRNLPVLFEQLVLNLDGKMPGLSGIGVSTCPRSLPDSYMPVFVVGESCARSLACVSGTNLFRLSHQENHILAGIHSASWPQKPEFLVLHISGGTTEIVKVKIKKDITVEILGGSMDLHAGQFIDRIGVLLGLPFPAGPHLEKLAARAIKTLKLPISVAGFQVSFSGPETHAIRLHEKGEDPSCLGAGVQHCVADTMLRLIQNSAAATGLNEVLVVGGVSANNYIRNYLSENLARFAVRLYFPENQFSSDNATGAAFFAFLHSTNMFTSA